VKIIRIPDPKRRASDGGGRREGDVRGFRLEALHGWGHSCWTYQETEEGKGEKEKEKREDYFIKKDLGMNVWNLKGDPTSYNSEADLFQ